MNEESKTISSTTGSPQGRGKATRSPQQSPTGGSEAKSGEENVETREDKIAAIDEIITPFKLSPEVASAAIEIGQLISKAQRRNPRRIRWLVANARARAYESKGK